MREQIEAISVMQRGPWNIDANKGIITHDATPFYEVPLTEFSDPLKAVSWLRQLSEKSWVLNDHLGCLVRALNEIGLLVPAARA